MSYTEAADRSQDPITLDAGQKLRAPALTALPTNTLTQTLASADRAARRSRAVVAGDPGQDLPRRRR